MFSKLSKLTLVIAIVAAASCNRNIQKGPSSTTSSPNTSSSSSTPPSSADNVPSEPSKGDISMSGMEAEILDNINQYRASIGKPAMKNAPAASAEAAKHSASMASKSSGFGHAGFKIRITNITRQIGPVSAAAENVAYGKLTAREVVDGWIKSPGHKKNIEGVYTLSGIGLAKNDKGVIFFTQIFLKK
ncbi:CAP domain-containing protein [Foetidibacter luteolus]|uniref:CAP domain-containing protein n=1 Tax=Foetidibacter luteolus TaxID=2608880 RepID=UPI00129B4E4E|nr:CAP domain-containing protein [Foetidibacter luteolus]